MKCFAVVVMWMILYAESASAQDRVSYNPMSAGVGEISFNPFPAPVAKPVAVYVNQPGSPDDVVAQTRAGEPITRKVWDALSPPESPFREDVARYKVVSGAEWSRGVFDTQGTLIGTVWGTPPRVMSRFGTPQGAFRPQQMAANRFATPIMSSSACANGRCGQ